MLNQILIAAMIVVGLFAVALYVVRAFRTDRQRNWRDDIE